MSVEPWILPTDALIFVQPAGVERFLLVGPPHVAAGTRLPPALQTYLNAQGRSNLARPESQAWTVSDELGAISRLTGRTVPAG